MPSTHTSAEKGQMIWFDGNVIDRFEPDWFTPAYWQRTGALLGSAQGRGTTHFFHYQGHEFVLRHYRRGGLPGKILHDQYWYAGLARTRAWRELNLLLQLRDIGLPVPRPVAAQVTRQLFYYRSDFVSEKIPHAEDVHSLLKQAPLGGKLWYKIGATIGRFHHAQVYHHDLNIHNIMLDKQDQAWLIDFDKCAIQTGNRWKKANLQRLLRSLHKEQTRQSAYYFSSQDWQALLAGYEKSN